MSSRIELSRVRQTFLVRGDEDRALREFVALDDLDLVVEAGLMSREEVDKQLSPARLSGLQAVTAAIPIVLADAEESVSG